MECKVCGEEVKRHAGARTCVPCANNIQRLIMTKVQSIMSMAKRKGIIEEINGTQLCMDCGKPAECYDHRDYFKPLDVDPVCLSCNRIRGTAKNRENIREAKKELWDKDWVKSTNSVKNRTASYRKMEELHKKVEELWKREKKKQSRRNTRTTS